MRRKGRDGVFGEATAHPRPAFPLRRLAVGSVAFCAALAAPPALAAHLLLDDFESYAFAGSDPDRDPTNPGDGNANDWQVAESAGGSALQVLVDSADDYNQAVVIANPAGGATVSLQRDFETIAAGDFAAVVEVRFRVRIDDALPPSDTTLHLESSGGGELARIHVAPHGTGSAAGISVEAATGGAGGSALRESLVATLNAGEWYEVTLRANLERQLVEAQAHNLTAPGTGQAGATSVLLDFLADVSSTDRIRFETASEAAVSFDAVRVSRRATANLLAFGEFESLVAGVPNGWQLSNGSSSQIALDTTAPLSGGASLTFDVAAGESRVGIVLANRIPVGAGATYRVRYNHRVNSIISSGFQALSFEVLFYDAVDALIPDPSSERSIAGSAHDPTGSWDSRYREIVAPPGAVTMDLRLMSASSFFGSVSFDRLRVEELVSPAFAKPPSSRAFDFVEIGESATPGFTAVPMDKGFDPGTPDDYGWDYAGSEISASQKRRADAEYPSFFQSNAVGKEEFWIDLPESDAVPTDYRVTIFTGAIERVPSTGQVTNIQINGGAAVATDGALSLADVMDQRYFLRTRDAGVTDRYVSEGAEAVYQDYVRRRFKTYTLTVPGVQGEMEIDSVTGFMNGVVVTPLADQAAHDAAVADFEAELEQAFIAKWAEQEPTDPLRGARGGSYTPPADAAYVLFQRHWMEAVEYDSRPDADELLAGLHVRATPGEYEPVTFSIWPRKRLDDVRILVSALHGPGGATLPRGAVRVWALQHKPLRNTRPATSWRIEGTYLPDWHAPSGVGQTLYKDLAQRAWLSVHVPEGTPPGTYAGTLTLQPSAGEAPATAVPFEVEVYGFELLRRKRVHSLRGAGNGVLIPYEGTYDQSPPGPASYAAIGQSPGDSRTHQFYRKAALEDLLAHGFVPEWSPWWPGAYDKDTGTMDWSVESWGATQAEWLQLIKDSPFGATGELWVDGASVSVCCLIDAFDTASSWTPDDVAEFLQMLYNDVGPGSTYPFGGWSRLLLHASAEESHYLGNPTRWAGWLAMLDFIRNGDATHDAASWGNDPLDPSSNTIVTVHTFNTEEGHAATVPAGLVDLPFLGMFHGVGEVDDLPSNGAQQVADVPAGQPFGLYGNRGRFVGGYYLWRAGGQNESFDGLGTFHEFYSRYYGELNNDWDVDIDPVGAYAVPEVFSEAPGWIPITYSETGRMIGSWFWEELREGVDDEAYLQTLVHWVEVTENHPDASVAAARAGGASLLFALAGAIELDVDKTKLLFVRQGLTLYRPETPQTLDAWRAAAGDAIGAIIAAAEQTLAIAGTAQGGDVSFLLNGVLVSVPTTLGQNATEVAADIAAAIEAEGIPARASGATVTTYGAITSLAISDPGLYLPVRTIPALGPWPALLALGLACAVALALRWPIDRAAR